MQKASFILCALLLAPSSVMAQQADPRLIAPLQIQRDEQANLRAYCMLEMTKLREEVEKLQTQVAKVPPYPIDPNL